MDSSKLFLIIFVYVTIVYPEDRSSAAFANETPRISQTKLKQKEIPCDTCPRQGRCVPKIACPAHVRSGARSPECHLASQLGVCCYTGQSHAAEFERKPKMRSSRNIGDLRKSALDASEAKWREWSRRSQKILEHGDDTLVSHRSPDFGHHLSSTGQDKKAQKLNEGALRNMFMVQELKVRQAIDDDELALDYYHDIDGPYCPPQPSCPDPPSPFRAVSGTCTNPHHPTWGAANSGYERLLPPDYSDGIWDFRTSITGAPLPSPRVVSTALLLDGDYPSPKLNLIFAQFSQFIAHDVSAASTYTIGNGSSISCCTKEGQFLPPDSLHYACAPIAVDPSDEFYSVFGRSCLNFVRAQLAPSPDCSCGYAKQMNGATHIPDLSHLYGKTEEKQEALRAPGGALRVFDNYRRHLPPLTHSSDCLNDKDGDACFASGDNHANQLITLTAFHTIFTRAHNRLAAGLRDANPGLDEHALFHHAKRVLQASYQHIIYNEWLPLLIGPELVQVFGLVPSAGYSGTYDPTVSPAVMTEFAGAAMRFGHSAIDGRIRVGNPESGKLEELISISEVMFQPARLKLRHFLDQLVYGMSWQPMQIVDPFLTIGLTRYMFRGTNAFGLDLASINIQRGRDLGLRSYNQYRRLVGLQPYDTFHQFPPSASKRLSSVYAHPEDIDLWIGCLLEEPIEGGIIGPTCAHIIAEQFSRFKKGDRYYYEYGPEVNPGAFTPNQLAEIKKMSIARLFCDNIDGDKLTSMPPHAFLTPDQPGNAPIPCDYSYMPQMDMSRFKLR